MKKFYKNGAWEEFILVNGAKNGEATYHYAENDPECRDVENYEYRNGVITGDSMLYFRDSDKKYETRTYKDGVLNGTGIRYFSDTEYEVRTYKDGVPEGEATYCRNDGIESTQIYFYKNGVIDGPAEIRIKDRDQNKLIKARYKNGRLQGEAVCYYDEEEKEYEEFNYNNGVCEGKFVHYYNGPEGKYEVGNYENGRKNGEAILCTPLRDENGRRHFEYSKAEYKVEKFTRYSGGDSTPNSTIEIRNYVDGKLQGKAVIYDGNVPFGNYSYNLELRVVGTTNIFGSSHEEEYRQEQKRLKRELELRKFDLEHMKKNIISNGIYEKFNYVDGKRQGRYVKNMGNGGLLNILKFSLFGHTKSGFETPVSEIGSYVNGIPQGEATVYYDTPGNVYEIFEYVDGEKHGQSVFFYDEKNSVIEVRNYIHGKLQGNGGLYVEGKLTSIRVYENGRLTHETDVGV